ncbi:MAG: hypothetical protein ACI9YE_003889 [Psychroserpens sp.]|jgi:hypothetical protein
MISVIEDINKRLNINLTEDPDKLGIYSEQNGFDIISIDMNKHHPQLHVTKIHNLKMLTIVEQINEIIN